jgi:acyl-CoA thioester hydrolase
MGVGPIYTAIHAQYLREVRMGETITIGFCLAGISPQGSRWKVHHDVLKANAKKAVSIDIEGAMLELSSRKPVAPGPELLQTFNLVPRTKDFETLSEMRWIGAAVS